MKKILFILLALTMGCAKESVTVEQAQKIVDSVKASHPTVTTDTIIAKVILFVDVRSYETSDASHQHAHYMVINQKEQSCEISPLDYALVKETISTVTCAWDKLNIMTQTAIWNF
jgi:hypothetical protein